jgi:hypothetical protein
VNAERGRVFLIGHPLRPMTVPLRDSLAGAPLAMIQTSSDTGRRRTWPDSDSSHVVSYVSDALAAMTRCLRLDEFAAHHSEPA